MKRLLYCVLWLVVAGLCLWWVCAISGNRPNLPYAQAAVALVGLIISLLMALLCFLGWVFRKGWDIWHEGTWE